MYVCINHSLYKYSFFIFPFSLNKFVMFFSKKKTSLYEYSFFYFPFFIEHIRKVFQ